MKDKTDDTHNSYIALDLETTGVHPKLDRIIEIGALKVEDGQVVDTYKSFIDPRCEISEQITELTHISESDVEGAPIIEDKIEEIVDWIDGGTLLGHNILFDYSFLKRAAVNHGISFEARGIDTVKICRILMPPDERKSLPVACKFYGVDTGQSHRAFDDARASHLLYQKLREYINDKNSKAFEAKILNCQIKREQQASERQKEHLRKLLNYHKIESNVLLDSMSKNEISRMTDRIILKYGRIV